jgi:hypothetical protein
MISIFNISPEHVVFKGAEHPLKKYRYIEVNGQHIAIEKTSVQGCLTRLVQSLIEERTLVKAKG